MTDATYAADLADLASRIAAADFRRPQPHPPMTAPAQPSAAPAAVVEQLTTEIADLRERIAAAEERGAWATAGSLKTRWTNVQKQLATATAAAVGPDVLAARDARRAELKAQIAERENAGQFGPLLEAMKSELVRLSPSR